MHKNIGDYPGKSKLKQNIMIDTEAYEENKSTEFYSLYGLLDPD